MMGGLLTDLAPLIEFTPAGILGLVVVLIAAGYLLPLRIVRGRLADKDYIIAEQRRVIVILQQNNAQLLLGNTAAVHVLDALPDVVGVGNDSVV